MTASGRLAGDRRRRRGTGKTTRRRSRWSPAAWIGRRHVARIVAIAEQPRAGPAAAGRAGRADGQGRGATSGGRPRGGGEAAVGERSAELLLGLRASTLHRLLGWRPGSHSRFAHDRGNRLPHDVVIVDETSMVSLSLMARLVEAVRPDARLILVGDPGQLASIEAGVVLGDIVGRPSPPRRGHRRARARPPLRRRDRAARRRDPPRRRRRRRSRRSARRRTRSPGWPIDVHESRGRPGAGPRAGGRGRARRWSSGRARRERRRRRSRRSAGSGCCAPTAAALTA